MKNKKWFLKRVFVNNFKPFPFEKNPKEIPFVTEGKIVDLMVLAGFNGYGKTSIFQAIEFALSGKIELFEFKDTNKKVEEHIIVNELEKESLVALEFCTENINEVKTIIRYNANSQARKEKEFKDFDMFIINQNFNYENFKDERKTKKIKKKNIKDLEVEFGQTFIDEWIRTNYIKQEQISNILFKTNKERVGFVEKFIENELEEEIYFLNEKLDEVSANIKDTSKSLSEIVKKQKAIKKIVLGEKPKEIVLFPEGAFVWDKLEYAENEPFEIYLKDIKNIKEIIDYSDEYQNKFELDIIEKAQKYNLQEVILFATIKDKIEFYLQNIKKKRYLQEFMEKDLICTNYILSNEFMDEDIVAAITEYRLDMKKINELKNRKDELFIETKKIRVRLQQNSEITKELFEDTCPICGCEYTTKERLIDSINMYESTFASIDSNLQENMKILIQSTDIKKNIILAKIKQKIDMIKFEDGLIVLIDNISKNTKVLTEYIDNIESIGISICKLEFLNFEELSSLEKKLKERLDFKKLALNRKFEGNSEFVLDINNYNTFKQIKNYSKLDFFSKVKLLSELNVKEIYIKWSINKRDLQRNIEFKEQKEVEVTKLRDLLHQESKLNKILTIIKEAKDIYMDKIISTIEIPLYIYSGKLLQTHQNGLGVFCTTGPTKDKFTQFKLTSNRGIYGHDIINKFSAGQKAIINIAVMLAFRKIRKFNLDVFLIDDPCQSMDDINIASLVEILRNEFDDTQLILSTHDDKIASYMCYKYFKSGKHYNKFDVQKNLYQIEDFNG